MPSIQLSQYIGWQERRGWAVVYHLLHPVPFYLPIAEWKAALANPNNIPVKIVDKLRSNGLIATLEEDLQDLTNTHAGISRKLARPTILYLMMAQHCNYACRYCPIPTLAKKHGKNLLSLENAQAGIDLWSNHIQDWGNDGGEFFAIFYGGEPLLNKSTIRSATEYIRRMQSRDLLPNNGLNLMITTNGALLDKDILDLCQTEGISVAVGIDGLEKANDLVRIDSQGHGTFKEIDDAITLLTSHRIRTYASIAMTPANLGEVHGLADFLHTRGVEKIGLNFLKGKVLLEMLGDETPESFYRRSSRIVIDLFLHSGQSRFEYQTEKKLFAFHNGQFFPQDCTCYGNQIVVQADGQVTNCPFHREDQGHVQTLNTGFRIGETEIVHMWQQRLLSIGKDSPVQDGSALSGGGCAWSCIELTNDCLSLDRASQIFSEEIFNELIWSNFENSS